MEIITTFLYIFDQCFFSVFFVFGGDLDVTPRVKRPSHEPLPIGSLSRSIFAFTRADNHAIFGIELLRPRN
jgi:hypothetical protein